MGHTPPIFLTRGNKTSAFLSLGNPNSLVVFVHGFTGKATGTWDKFPDFIRNKKDFVNCDIIFYDYASVKGQANNNALKFYNFLNSVCEKSPNKLGYKRAEVDNDFRYERILIVAHSLGAIIVRRALLNAKHENKQWLQYCKMVLFAPAHRGAIIPNLMMQCLPVVGKVLAGLGTLIIPVLNDLKPDSQTIKNLISDSQNYLNQKNGDFTIAHQVVWADKDIVVHNDQFCSDPIAKLILKKKHTNVCTPNNQYLEPYKIVVNALNYL